jgi:RNA processing factor Prp31
MISLSLYRNELYSYLEEYMVAVASNLSAVMREIVYAKLFDLAVSLTSLAKCCVLLW